MDWFGWVSTPTVVWRTRAFLSITFTFCDAWSDLCCDWSDRIPKLLSGHNILFIWLLRWLLVPADLLGNLQNTFCLRLRAVGENPHAWYCGYFGAVHSLSCLIIGASLVGIAGAIYRRLIMPVSWKHSAGKVNMALAALDFGKWRPFRVALPVCVGFLDAVAIRMQGVVVPGLARVTRSGNEVLPYV